MSTASLSIARLQEAFPGLGTVLAALQDDVFLVGGCVRDALLGLRVRDIDFATPFLPDRVIARLDNAGLRSIPTGLAHGTVTAIAAGHAFEITTFRRDVQTDGRHAVVAFCSEIAADAARRDFTINALYATPSGTVIDPLAQGLADLQARRIRFIGDAHARITEDHLRILRFFRFNAWYGHKTLDARGLAACSDRASTLAQIPAERIGHEMRRLLAAPDPAPSLDAMARAGVLDYCLPGASTELITPLIAAETAIGAPADWRTRLAAIGGRAPQKYLKLSRAETRALRAIETLVEWQLAPAPAAWSKGIDAARAAALVLAAHRGSTPPDLEHQLSRGATARCPISAQDLITAGFAPGPALGTALDHAQNQWLASNLELSAQDLLSCVKSAPRDKPHSQNG